MAPYKDAVMLNLNLDEIRHEDHNSAHDRASNVQAITKDCFKPGVHAPVLPLRAITGKSKTVSLHTTSVYNDAKQYAHINLWRYCMRFKTWGYIVKAWLIGSVRPGQMVSHKETNVFSLAVNLVEGLAAMCIKLVEKQYNGGEL